MHDVIWKKNVHSVEILEFFCHWHRYFTWNQLRNLIFWILEALNFDFWNILEFQTLKNYLLAILELWIFEVMLVIFLDCLELSNQKLQMKHFWTFWILIYLFHVKSLWQKNPKISTLWIDRLRYIRPVWFHEILPWTH